MDILSLIVGGTIGFFASTAKDLLMENKKQKLKKQEFQREKLEEIYLLFEKWNTHFSSIYLTFLACYYNTLDYKDVSEVTKSFNTLLPGEAQKLQMLINIHFPILVHDYIPVEQARSKIAPFLTNPKENKLSVEDFIKTQETFEAVSKEFKSTIISLAQKINP